ncbi:MAG: pyrroline-5-carboxylate reductase [Acidobacteriota bacterium]|nr:pyrroline-5-carboxylate reductase [Acidobacteriota bacterium]
MSEAPEKDRGGMERLAVIGAGKMGTTLIHAVIDGGLFSPQRIVASGRREEPLAELAEREKVVITGNNRAACRDADTVLLCVKPQTVGEVLAEIGPELNPRQTLISIAAGVSTLQLESHLPAGLPTVRAMPNTPSLLGAGMTAVCGGASSTEQHLEKADKIFACMGRTVVLDEKHFDAVTGLSASGPAFIYIVIEAMAEGGVKTGLPRQVATELAAQTCFGAAKMVLETENHPALLKDDVTTPAGCTMDGILKLEEGGLRVTLIKAVVEATRSAGGLGAGS